jgi:Increased loss of mitochondrial DNA protein 1
MPLLPSHTLILTHSLTCLTTSFVLLTRPHLITSSAPVWLIGEAMHIRDTPSFSLPSEPLAALALVLAVLGIVEAVFAGSLAGANTSSKKEEDIQAFAERAAVLHNAQGQWMTTSTLKSLMFGLLVMYSYLTTKREQGMGYVVPVERGAGLFGFGMLNNRVMFLGAFAEMLFWGYLWTTLKDERKDLAKGIRKRREEGREKGEEVWDR